MGIISDRYLISVDKQLKIVATLDKKIAFWIDTSSSAFFSAAENAAIASIKTTEKRQKISTNR